MFCQNNVLGVVFYLLKAIFARIELKNFQSYFVHKPHRNNV